MQKQRNNNADNNKSFQTQTIQKEELLNIKGGFFITEDWLDL